MTQPTVIIGPGLLKTHLSGWAVRNILIANNTLQKEGLISPTFLKYELTIFDQYWLKFYQIPAFLFLFNIFTYLHLMQK